MNVMRFIGGVFVAAILVAMLTPSTAWADDAKPPRPNIVVILADDLGYSDLGCYGGEISTPNLDKLAGRGVRFAEFYNMGRCCPSRAALMTGRYQHQVGVGAMIDGYAKWIRDAANRPSYTEGLSTDSPTMPELLRATGYRTMMSGKWHLGYQPEQWPVKRGFDRSFALIPGAMNYWGGESDGPRAPMALDDQKFTPPHDGFFATDAFTDKAIEFLGEPRKPDQPYFLYLAYNAPHWPLQAQPAEIEKYKSTYGKAWQEHREDRLKRLRELKLIGPDAPMAPVDRGNVQPWTKLSQEAKDEWSLRMAIYAAQVTKLDESIGRVIDSIEKSGQADNTLVLFISDNGGAPEDPHRGKPGATLGSRDSFWGYARPWATVSNTPWRGHKVTAYEGGISTPAIVSWPAGIPKIAEGSIVRGPAHLMDLLPTFLELAGGKYPATETIHPEGRNIAGMFRGEAGANDRTLCWEHEGNRAVRKGKWKLVTLANSTDGWELYDLDADRIEGNNLASAHPEIVKELSAEYDRWAERCGVVPWSEIEPKRPAGRGGK